MSGDKTGKIPRERLEGLINDSRLQEKIDTAEVPAVDFSDEEPTISFDLEATTQPVDSANVKAMELDTTAVIEEKKKEIREIPLINNIITSRRFDINYIADLDIDADKAVIIIRHALNLDVTFDIFSDPEVKLLQKAITQLSSSKIHG